METPVRNAKSEEHNDRLVTKAVNAMREEGQGNAEADSIDFLLCARATGMDLRGLLEEYRADEIVFDDLIDILECAVRRSESDSHFGEEKIAFYTTVLDGIKDELVRS